jgi:hypothetical protein
MVVDGYPPAGIGLWLGSPGAHWQEDDLAGQQQQQQQQQKKQEKKPVAAHEASSSSSSSSSQGLECVMFPSIKDINIPDEPDEPLQCWPLSVHGGQTNQM